MPRRIAVSRGILAASAPLGYGRFAARRCNRCTTAPQPGVAPHPASDEEPIVAIPVQLYLDSAKHRSLPLGRRFRRSGGGVAAEPGDEDARNSVAVPPYRDASNDTDCVKPRSHARMSGSRPALRVPPWHPSVSLSTEYPEAPPASYQIGRRCRPSFARAPQRIPESAHYGKTHAYRRNALGRNPGRRARRH
jgi:hypothetical protein